MTSTAGRVRVGAAATPTTITPARPARNTGRPHRRVARRITGDGRAAPAAATAFVAAACSLLIGGLAAFDGGYYAPAWGWSGLGLAWTAGVAVFMLRIAPGRTAVVWVGLVLALAFWIWLSGAWSISPTLTLLEGQRVLVYAGAAVVAGWCIPPGSIGWITAAIVTPATAIATYALARYGRGAVSLAEPIGYSNALGLLCVLGLLLAGALAAEGARMSIRVAAIAAAIPLGLTTFLAGARGPLLALVAGIAVAAALGIRSRHSAIAGIAAGVVMVAVVGGGVATGATPASLTTLREELITVAPHDRDRYWTAAWNAARDEPVLGAGAGTFERLWLRHRDVNIGVLDAHNLYLESLAELGLVGLALVVVMLGMPLVAARRARNRPFVPLVAGAYAAYVVHVAIDWSWELPVVTVPAILLGGVLVSEATPTTVAATAIDTLRVGSVAAVVGTCAFVGLMANSALTASVLALDHGDYARATSEANAARPWGLWSAEPDRLAAEAAAARGDAHTARALAISALELDPSNVRLWRLLANVSPNDRSRAFERIEELDPQGPPPLSH